MESDNVFFSIIVAVYNVDPFVRQCIDSVVSQSCSDWELIIIDDCSEDKTKSIVREYLSDRRIKLIESERNSGGGFVPREIGAKAATGKYIVHLDGDDIIPNDYLSRMKLCIESTEADLVLPEMWRFKGNISEAYKILPDSQIDTERSWVGKDLIKHTLGTWQISLGGYAVKKEIFLQACKEVRESTEDYNLSDEMQSRYMLLLSRKVVMIPIHYYYRINNASVTSNTEGELIRAKAINPQLVNLGIKYFGKESVEYSQAAINYGFLILRMYEILDHKHLNTSMKALIYKEIQEIRQNMDIALIKNKVGLHYYLSLSLPENLGRPLYRMIRQIRKLRQR